MRSSGVQEFEELQEFEAAPASPVRNASPSDAGTGYANVADGSSRIND
jgi:hypothetical protein